MLKNEKNYIKNSDFSKHLIINLSVNRSIEKRKKGSKIYNTQKYV